MSAWWSFVATYYLYIAHLCGRAARVALLHAGLPASSRLLHALVLIAYSLAAP